MTAGPDRRRAGLRRAWIRVPVQVADQVAPPDPPKPPRLGRLLTAASLGNPAFGVFGVVVLVQVGDEHVGAFTGEGDCHRLADAAAGLR